MKYNRSEIFKKAWGLKKLIGDITFGECLKNAWQRAKEEVVKAKTVVKKAVRINNVAKWFLKKMETVDFMALDSGIWDDDIILERETAKAIEISTEWNYGKRKIWLPKSVIEYSFI